MLFRVTCSLTDDLYAIESKIVNEKRIRDVNDVNEIDKEAESNNLWLFTARKLYAE